MAPIKTKEKNINHSFHNIDIGRDMKLITIVVAVLILFLIPARAAENEIVTETVTMPRELVLLSTGAKIILIILEMMSTLVSMGVMLASVIPLLGIIIALCIVIVHIIFCLPWYVVAYGMIFLDLILGIFLPSPLRLILRSFHLIMKIPHYAMGSFHLMLHSPTLLLKDIRVFFEGLKDLPGIFLQL